MGATVGEYRVVTVAEHDLELVRDKGYDLYWICIKCDGTFNFEYHVPTEDDIIKLLEKV